MTTPANLAQQKSDYVNALIKENGVSLTGASKAMFDKLMANVARNAQAQQAAQQHQQGLQQAQQALVESNAATGVLADLLFDQRPQTAAAPEPTPAANSTHPEVIEKVGLA